MMKLFGLMLALFAASFAVGAADDAPPAAANGGAGAPPPAMNGGGRERFRQMIQTVREQYPEEFAEVEKLRASDPRAAMMKMRELMEKSGFSMPRPGEDRNNGQDNGGARNVRREPPKVAESDLAIYLRHLVNFLRAKAPDEWADVELTLATDPERGWRRFVAMCGKYGRQVPENATVKDLNINPVSERDVVRVTMERIDREIKRKFPGEYRELVSARVSDPVRARKLFRQLVAQGNISTELVVPGTAASESAEASKSDANSPASSAPSEGGNEGRRRQWGRRGGFGNEGAGDFSLRRLRWSRNQGNGNNGGNGGNAGDANSGNAGRTNP